ncbi:MAG: hypothetical protein WC467_03810 [Patescibacteria group bacterium]
MEETEDERNKIQDIIRLRNEIDKRRTRITYYVFVCALAYVLIATQGWINWYLIPIMIAVLLAGFLFADSKFIQYCSEGVQKKGEDLFSLKEVASKKKDMILQESDNVSKYLSYLQQETMKAVLNDFDYYSVCMKNKGEVDQERKRIINEIRSAFSKRGLFLSFTSSYQDLKFEFSRKFNYKWGDGLEHTKICQISAHGDKISFYSYSYYPSYF